MRNKVCGLGGRLAAQSVALFALLAGLGKAQTFPALDETQWSLHGQMTFVEQYHPAFRSPFRGANSLDPASRGNETFDATLFAGARVWDGGEVYANPEIDQGFGLSNTLGLAGFPSGEAYKVGKASPYFRLHRLFFRQSFDLGGETQEVESDANQLAGSRTANNLLVTAGKFSPTDVFDANTYAHDPKKDFLNWALIDSGAYDYAADAWGFSYGVAVEWTQDWWTLRAGLFDLSRIPNTTRLVRGFGQYELVAEAEERHMLWGEDCKIRLLGFLNRGRMGSYRDAIALGLSTHATPDTSLVRRPASRPGVALNIEQAIDDDLGAFLRLSFNDGSEEAYEFTEINESAAVGMSLKGTKWGRPNDTIGLAGVINGISNSARAYFAAGGLGILIGDGQLRRYGPEQIVETYYSAELTDSLAGSIDYQLVVNPAYNRERGPVSVLGARLHAQF
ncbi:MAG: carbohydrate porin [Alphaproteobacteria bacterium]|nr:carbohydrate porin [Alphaproteobacteria bacterium]MBL7097151.1 carbohydrate porin [Alphaproteobacteria bacterium]